MFFSGKIHFYLAGFFSFNIQSGTSHPEDLITFAILRKEIYFIITVKILNKLDKHSNKQEINNFKRPSLNPNERGKGGGGRAGGKGTYNQHASNEKYSAMSGVSY